MREEKTLRLECLKLGFQHVWNCVHTLDAGRWSRIPKCRDVLNATKYFSNYVLNGVDDPRLLNDEEDPRD